ncbi:hypothetical protein [Spirosoma koreense]
MKEQELREPNRGVLNFIRENKPIRWDEPLELWYRLQDYEAQETIVDIAIREHMPIWAAEQTFFSAIGKADDS